MAQLSWTRTDSGYESGRFFIRYLPGHPTHRWQLEVTLTDRRHAQEIVQASAHKTLESAQRRAQIRERERIRRIRVRGHAVLGLVSAIGFIATLTSLSGLIPFALMALFFWLMVTSFANAIGSLLSDAWGWPRQSGAGVVLGLSDRIVNAVVRRFPNLFGSDLQGASDEQLITGNDVSD